MEGVLPFSHGVICRFPAEGNSTLNIHSAALGQDTSAAFESAAIEPKSHG